MISASAADDASDSSTWRSASENRPSPRVLLTSSIAPTQRSFTLIGAHRMERVVKPVSTSTVRAKSGSSRTSRTIWHALAPTARPTMPRSAGMRSPLMSTGPTQAWHSSSVPSFSSRNSEAASACR